MSGLSILTNEDIEFLNRCIDGEEDFYFYGSPVFEKLFEYYREEMPYGVQKARDGIPEDWILDRIGPELAGATPDEGEE